MDSEIEKRRALGIKKQIKITYVCDLETDAIEDALLDKRETLMTIMNGINKNGIASMWVYSSEVDSVENIT